MATKADIRFAENVKTYGFWEAVRLRARYGHRDWIICHYKFSHYAAWPTDADSIGCARLCIREGGSAFSVCRKTGHVHKLTEGICDIMKRNAEAGYL